MFMSWCVRKGSSGKFRGEGWEMLWKRRTREKLSSRLVAKSPHELLRFASSYIYIYCHICSYIYIYIYYRIDE